MTLKELVLADDNIVYATDVSSVVDHKTQHYFNVGGQMSAVKRLDDVILNAQVTLIEPSFDGMIDVWVLVS